MRGADQERDTSGGPGGDRDARAASDERDAVARERDLATQDRDAEAEQHDRDADALDGAANAGDPALELRAAGDRRDAADDRARAAGARAEAAHDREQATLDRQGAADDREQATVDRQDAAAVLEQEGRFLRAVLDSVQDGIVACDSHGTLTVFNRATRALHGLPARALPPERWAEHYDLYHADGRTPMNKEDIPLFRALQGEQIREMEMVVAPKDGDRRLLCASGQPILASDGSTWGAVVALHDITDRKRAEDRLAYQALHDPLTGLANRTLLLDRIGRALELSKRGTSKIAVLFLDLDNFKAINDGFGHQLGDQLLKEVGSRLISGLRASDATTRLGGETVGRLGGDEFVVLCEGIRSEEDGLRIAERLKRAIAAPFTLQDTELSVTASIGITFPADPRADAGSLIRDADVAMYRAKDQGRNRCEVFDGAMRTRVMERLRVESELRGVIKRDELTLHYQPIVSVTDGSVVGLEALVRWEHPQRGVVAPADFIPLAEESGLIVAIGAWVLEEACRQTARWQEAHPRSPPVQVFVNVSERQLTPDFIDTVSNALEQSGLDPTRLVLEITESVVVESPQSADLLRALRKRGVQLALDDFGTGYSSLAYLTRFPLDILKIDRSLLANLGQGEQAFKVAAAAIEMGRALGMTVIGEGVETTEQLAHLQELDCPFAQGYLFAKPQPAAAITQLLCVTNAEGGVV
jgi:diguanylate cyclase (GGDEF)-like protein/PAS domain S-box-containing protein